MPGWNLADVWETVAGSLPDAPAQVQGDRQFTWADFDRRADGVAAALLAAGAGEQDKVAQYLFNAPEYLESLFACFKAGLVPVNTNYRYVDDELVYLWGNADAVAVVFHGTFSDTVDRVRARVPRVRTWLWVDDGSGPCPDWAIPYEDAATSPTSGPVRAPWGRDGDHLYLLYTGGTTGMPKGVMWRQDDLVGLLDTDTKRPLPTDPDLDAVRSRTVKPGPVGLPACPLMHGTGVLNAFSMLILGGSVVTLTNRHLDVVELLDTVEREGVKGLFIVGDAFAKPILRALDTESGRWDISSLRVIISSGVMWSEETKRGLLRHNPRLILVDSLGSSEAIGMAQSVSSAEESARTAAFRLGPDTKVITEDGSEVEPGSGEMGRVALRGRMPIGYYKDPDKSAATFVTVEGQRWSIPGDFATVEADGSLRLFGRGSVCINTGGEKVYPEEVEEALKRHPAVHDAVAVGVPDERFGEAVTAVVEPAPDADLDEGAVIAFVKEHLAHYKAPRRVLVVDSIGRAPNGKVDYKRLRSLAAERVGSAS
jgi:acyl-CoA synthetase (AMP-forming)/AMP-acid ligase II